MTPRLTRPPRPTRLHVIRTRYPHWGRHSGIHQFLRHLDPGRFSIDERLAADGDDDFPLRSPAVRRRLRGLVQRRGMAWYKLSDLDAEMRALAGCWRGRVDIVHYLDGEHSAQYLPALRPRHAGVVATFHQPPELLGGLLSESALRRLDRVTVVSPSQVDWFAERLGADRVALVLHGIDTEFFRPSANFGRSTGPAFVGAVHGRPSGTPCGRPGWAAAAEQGKLLQGGHAGCLRHPADRPYENLGTAVKLAPMRPGGEGFRCLTVGHYLRDFTAIRAVAERLAGKAVEFHLVTDRDTGLEDLPSVHRHRNVDDAELLALYQGADALLLPVHQSTANNALLEGIACGLPVISSRLPSIAAYVPGGEAILIDGNDPDELAGAVLSLREDPEMAREMGRRARRRAEELSWHRIAPRYAEIYAEMAKG